MYNKICKSVLHFNNKFLCFVNSTQKQGLCSSSNPNKLNNKLTFWFMSRVSGRFTVMLFCFHKLVCLSNSALYVTARNFPNLIFVSLLLEIKCKMIIGARRKTKQCFVAQICIHFCTFWEKYWIYRTPIWTRIFCKVPKQVSAFICILFCQK